MARPLTGYQRAGSLRPGQVVTVLVGVGLRLHDLHRRGGLGGWLQPRHVLVGPDGRPEITPAGAPSNWQEQDDVAALLRLGMVLGRGNDQFVAALRQRCQRTPDSLADVVGWLLTVAAASPLNDPTSANVAPDRT